MRTRLHFPPTEVGDLVCLHPHLASCGPVHCASFEPYPTSRARLRMSAARFTKARAASLNRRARTCRIIGHPIVTASVRDYRDTHHASAVSSSVNSRPKWLSINDSARLPECTHRIHLLNLFATMPRYPNRSVVPTLLPHRLSAATSGVAWCH